MNPALPSDAQYLKCSTTRTGLISGNVKVKSSYYGKAESKLTQRYHQFAIFATGSKVADTHDGSLLHTYYIMWQANETNDRLYLFGDGIGNECPYWMKDGTTKDNINCAWLFISEKQYKIRQELSMYIDYINSRTDLTDEEKEAALRDIYAILDAEEFNESAAEQLYEEVRAENPDVFGYVVNISHDVSNLEQLNERYKSFAGCDNNRILELIEEGNNLSM